MLQACGGIGYYRDNLSEPVHTSYFEIEKDIEYFQILGEKRGEHTVLIRKGKYTAISENENGVFYTSEHEYDYLYKMVVDGELFNHPMVGLHQGGIWIPKSKEKNPRLYYLFGKSINYADGIKFLSEDRASNTKIHPENKSYDVGDPASMPVLDYAITSTVVNAIIWAEIGKINMSNEIPDYIFQDNIHIKTSN